ncbi:MAG: flagellar hook-basal body complex protein [Ethanoligenens sp.]|uniref:flagellar hook-basal body protein n=1 Tax=Ethanoligenens sp. TaxID=2099655 RepID=UPI0039E807BD
MRALNSAVTGLRAQQTAMDVIGNNIANVNTAGFKSSRTDFSDLFYQTLQGGTNTTNASEVGYGTKVSGISKDMSTTGYTATGISSNLFISGNGYFIVSNDDGSHTAGTSKSDLAANTATVNDLYTRVGNFKTTADGYLVDASGNYVMGVDASTLQTAAIKLHAINFVGSTFHPSDATGTTGDVTILDPNSTTATDATHVKWGSSAIQDMTFNQDGTISATINGVKGTFEYGTSVGATGAAATDNMTIGLASFANQDGLTQAGNTSFASSASSGSASYMQPMNNNQTYLVSGGLEQSNVDLAQEFTNMIVTQRGFQANSRVITVADSLLEEIVNLKRS